MNALSAALGAAVLCALAVAAVFVRAAPPHMNVLSATVSDMEFSAQSRGDRPRIRVQPVEPPAYDYPRPGDYAWPGPGAVRHCVDWYAIEHRPSGRVLTPQMRCRWVRG